MKKKLPLQRLVRAAKRAQTRAYCPYSRYPVGAAALTRSGRIFSGCNVENASFGLAICAERAAIFNAVSQGEKELVAVCVVAKGARPCGACRQVMLEFSSRKTQLICVEQDSNLRREKVRRLRIFDTLPTPFDPLESGLLAPNPRNLLMSRQRRGGARRRKRSVAPVRPRSRAERGRTRRKRGG